MHQTLKKGQDWKFKLDIFFAFADMFVNQDFVSLRRFYFTSQIKQSLELLQHSLSILFISEKHVGIWPHLLLVHSVDDRKREKAI